MKAIVRTKLATMILPGAVLAFSAGVPSAPAAVCLGATSSGPVFQSITFIPQTGTFTFEVDATPAASSPNVDGAVALGNTLMTAYTDLATVVRFHDNGLVDARNGSGYQSENNYPFILGVTYHVRMVVDVANKVYSAYVRAPGIPAETTIAKDYAFRSEQAGITTVNYWGAFSDLGSMSACNGVAYTSMTPNTGMWFNGVNSFVQAPDSDDFSVTTTGAITISAWLRPDTLTFPKNQGSGYVNWLGKGQGTGASGQQEWCFRMYSRGNTEGRQNRISFYVFNPQGGLGIGSHFQDAVTPGEWIHVVGVIDGQFTYLYKNGELRDCDQYRPGPKPSGSCNAYSFAVAPANGTAPLRIGTVDLGSFLQGGIKEVRIWNRALSGTEVATLYTGTVPSTGLVAEYLLEGDFVPDTAGSHTAASYASHWVPQQ
jgi:hypothetical protein